MVKFTILFLIVALSASSPALAQPACTELTITGHPEYPPIGYHDAGTIAGAGATLVEQIAANLGIAVTSRDFGTWEAAQMAARDGAADIIFGIYYNDDRATYLDYVAPPFTIDPVVVFVRAGAAFAFNDRDDLVGLRGITNKGESFGIEFDAFMANSLDVARADGVDVAFQALLAGDADYVIFGLYPGLAEAAQGGFTDQIEILSPNLVEADMFVAFSKLSPCLSLIEPFGNAIEEMRADGGINILIKEANEALKVLN